MSRKLTCAAGLLVLTTIALAGQETPPNAVPPQPPPAQGKPPAPEVRPPDPVGQPVNVKLDLTITDQSGPGDPAKKIVTMLIADRGNGSIRSAGYSNLSSNVRINVDARPQILSNGSVRLGLGLEYNPRVADSSAAAVSLHEQMTVILTPEKPMLISQSADPVSDRRVTVEVRATLLK